MQKITSHLPSWDSTKKGSKKGFDKAFKVVDKLGAPVNRLSNRIGSEAFWPTTLDKESDKAARILKSFCKDGFYTEEEPSPGVPSPGGPKQKQRVLKKIPASVIQNAVGLAIFTTMRTGLWISGAGGSGVLVARLPDGSWSPPSGILLHTAGLGFLVGVDIYDCVLVINTRAALAAFTKIRATLGGEVSAVAGPVGIGGVLENDGHWGGKQAGGGRRPVFTYLKSRGFYAGVQVDGTVVIERTDENARFYGEEEEVGVAAAAAEILAGRVRRVPGRETRRLMETLKAAEGSADADEGVMEELAAEPAPGDVEVASSPTTMTATFGVPGADDPDPYGVAALEREGLGIVEAGSHARVSSDQFEFRPRRSGSSLRPRASTAGSPPPYRASFGDVPARWSSGSAWTMTSDAATQTDGEDTAATTTTAETTPATTPATNSPAPRVPAGHDAAEAAREGDASSSRYDGRADSPYSAYSEGKLDDMRNYDAEGDEFLDGQHMAQKPVVLPKGPPPALPPRQVVVEAKSRTLETDFEDLDLNDAGK